MNENGFENVVLDEDGSYSINVNYSDVDDAELIISATSNNAFVSVSVESGDNISNLTITPDGDYFGSATITVTATESDNEASVETSFAVLILAVNDEPVISSTPPEDEIELGNTFLYFQKF